MISKKLLIMRRLTEVLEGITPAWTDLPPEMAGVVCPWDMSKSVFRGRAFYGKETKPPFISLLEAPRQLDPIYGGQTDVSAENWTLLVQGFVKEDQKHPTDEAYDLLAWVQMRLSRISQQQVNGGRGGMYPLQFRLGSLVADVAMQIPIVRPGKDDVSDTAYFYQPISVGKVTDLTMPFVKED